MWTAWTPDIKINTFWHLDGAVSWEFFPRSWSTSDVQSQEQEKYFPRKSFQIPVHYALPGDDVLQMGVRLELKGHHTECSRRLDSDCPLSPSGRIKQKLSESGLTSVSKNQKTWIQSFLLHCQWETRSISSSWNTSWKCVKKTLENLSRNSTPGTFPIKHPVTYTTMFIQRYSLSVLPLKALQQQVSI